jgi:hypothetical protein
MALGKLHLGKVAIWRYWDSQRILYFLWINIEFHNKVNGELHEPSRLEKIL